MAQAYRYGLKIVDPWECAQAGALRTETTVVVIDPPPETAILQQGCMGFWWDPAVHVSEIMKERSLPHQSWHQKRVNVARRTVQVEHQCAQRNGVSTTRTQSDAEDAFLGKWFGIEGALHTVKASMPICL
jgi:hypothetical protein